MFQANQQILRVLESSKAVTDRILRQRPSHLVLIDDQDRVLMMNKASENLFSISEADALGTSITNLWPNNPQNESIVDTIANRKSEPGNFQAIHTMQDQSRTLFWQCTPVELAGKHERVFALIGNDITDAQNALELSKDLEVARAAQSTLLPRESKIRTDFCEINGAYVPAAQVGGDLWWCKTTEDTAVAMIVDVMGHGAGAAMITAMVYGAIDCLTIDSREISDDDLHNIFSTLHRMLVNTCQGDILVAASAVKIHKQKETATLFGMGMPAGAVIKENGEHVNVISPGAPLGLEGLPYQPNQKEFELRAKERFALFSDGAYEIRIQGKLMGRPRFVRECVGLRAMPGDQANTTILNTLEELRESHEADDDITILTIDRF